MNDALFWEEIRSETQNTSLPMEDLAIINIDATDPTIIPIKAPSLNSVNVSVGQGRQSSMVVP